MDGTALRSAESNAALAAEIEAIVRATVGVRTVYRSGSLVSNVIGTGAVALGVSRSDEPLVAVAQGDLGVSVEASIGIDFTAAAADTLQAVHQAIDALLAAQATPRERIRLTVVYVQSREAS
ncbi:hypothetical protein SRABI76_02304 [Microbacterium oxydans]|uniref:hypothetical protein n=1 Tax=Microbacterium oxydans TaxID=82380 RepID=UPI001D86B1AD|nr:hypothetical protein [Microbacterium oxydans]CAH0212606.1 hypothetical protein SRABI76_02304 [Microbacterium oxydans]